MPKSSLSYTLISDAALGSLAALGVRRGGHQGHRGQQCARETGNAAGGSFADWALSGNQCNRTMIYLHKTGSHYPQNTQVPSGTPVHQAMGL